MRVQLDSILNIIRQNLNDRYHRGFPVIKELIQNADDAKATRFDFGLSPGLPHASHPLLQRPGLFVINDGGFTERDTAAINSIGLSSKPADHAAIGKFGLGLKSVFHFCEAFFYLHSEQRQLKLVNPWADDREHDRVHPAWNDVDPKDADLLIEHLRTILRPDAYFCLWIPLRRREDHAKIAPITNYYPGDTVHTGENLFALEHKNEANLYQQSAVLLPMLADLRLIQHWTKQNQDFEPSFRVELQAGSNRRRPISDLPADRPSVISGVLHLETLGANANSSLQFCGKELLLASASDLSALKESEYWPTQTVTDTETFEARTERDKAVSHAAVYFARHPRGNSEEASLFVNKAVFLPVDGPERRPLAGFTHDIYMVLHGYFFVDAGRSRIEGLDTEEVSGESKIPKLYAKSGMADCSDRERCF